MLGAVLLYVAVVLIINGVGRLTNLDPKSIAIMNLFTGGLSIVMNFGSLLIAQVQTPNNGAAFYPAATGLLFGFTYLFIGINSIFELKGEVFGWFCLFVAITSIPCGIWSWGHGGNIYNELMAIIWWAWGVLWLTTFIEGVLKKSLGWFPPVLSIAEGVLTAWIPGLMILINAWH